MMTPNGPTLIPDRRRDFGTVRLRGRIWWVRYKVNGKSHEESSGSTDRRKAEKLLERREVELGHGLFVAPDVKRTTGEDLAQMLRDDYRINGRRSLRRVETSLSHLLPEFGGTRAATITGDRVAAYVSKRLDDHAAPATIRNELAALKRMFTLGLRAGKVAQRPYIPAIEVSNARTGFFEEGEFRALVAELPDHLKPVVTFAYATGWRVPSEVLSLPWAQVDFAVGVVRLEVGSTKNGEGRTFPFAALASLAAMLRAQRERTTGVERRLGCVIPWVFHRDGRRIKGFRRAWLSACRRAGLVGMIPHDFRRTAVRNLVRAGVPERVAMQLTGHKTRSVFDPYNIVNERDLRDGVSRLAALHAGRGTAVRTVLPLLRGTMGGQ